MPRAAVLGSPIGHSLSPVLHRAAYAELGLGGWTYEAYDVDEAALPGFLDTLSGDWRGLSLTMPLKRAVIGLLDEISDTARVVDAVNTVLFRDGRRIGENTDVPGLVAALAERGVGGPARSEGLDSEAPGTGSVTVLGAGATAASALAAVLELAPRTVEAFVRGPRRAAEVSSLAERLGLALVTREWDEAADGLGADLVVATTPAGAADHLASAVPGAPGMLFDVVYDPWPTRLADAWAKAGGAVLGGLDLLVHQAVLQVELMTGRPAPVGALRRAGAAALAARAESRAR